MHPASIDVSRLPGLLSRCTRMGDFVQVPKDLRDMVIEVIASRFPFDTVEEIPIIGGRRKVTGFSKVRIRRNQTRIEGDAVIIIGAMQIMFGKKLIESDAFEEMFDFVADVSPTDIEVFISHPSSD